MCSRRSLWRVEWAGLWQSGRDRPSPLPLSEVASLAFRFWLGDFSFSYGRAVREGTPQ